MNRLIAMTLLLATPAWAAPAPPIPKQYDYEPASFRTVYLADAKELDSACTALAKDGYIIRFDPYAPICVVVEGLSCVAVIPDARGLDYNGIGNRLDYEFTHRAWALCNGWSE